MAPPRRSKAAPVSTRKRVGGASSSTTASRRRPKAVATSPVALEAPLSPPVELLSDDDGQLVLPARFQCPLCLDVLRAPIQLPCCRRHLCQQCFERALELTSANCGFCRKRIVGLARTKQYKVDEALWGEIRRCCPFVAHASGAADCLINIEFVDENAPPRPRGDSESASAVRAPEVTGSENAAQRPVAVYVSSHPVAPPPSNATTTPRRVTPTSANPKTKMQRQLDAFFAGTLPSPDGSRLAGSRPSSAGSVRSLRSTTSSSSGGSSGSSSKANGRGRRRRDAVGKKTAIETTRGKPLLRSTSHSPKHRAPQAVQRTLLQLTLHSPSSGTRETRQTPLANSSTSSKVTTRARRPWLCRHCTYENNCFDTRCIMCHQSPLL